MLNEKNIRQALDSRLSGLTASEDRRMRIRRAAYQERREDKPVKSKKTLFIAIAMTVVMLTSAIAVAETLNLFNFFGEKDERYAVLAPQATLEITEPALIEHPHLGSVTAEIDSAYFDGMALSLAYRVSNAAHVEAYTPTAEELAGMEKDTPTVVAVSADEPGMDVYQAFNMAVQNGTAYGYKRYAISAGDHTCTDDGVDIEPRTAWPEYDGTTLCELLEFAVPLADELRSRDTLTVTKEIYQHEYTVWFDGKDCWADYASEYIGVITATIPKAQDQVQTFSGTGKIGGADCAFTADVSPLAAVLTLTSDAPFNDFLPAAPEGVDPSDVWAELLLVDQAGREYRAQGGFQRNGQNTVTIVFDGTGELPTALTAYAYTNWESADKIDLTTLESVAMALAK